MKSESNDYFEKTGFYRPNFLNAGLNEICGFFSEELLAEKFKGIMEFADKPTSIERLAEKVTSADW